MRRWISCHGVWLGGYLNPPCFSSATRRCASSASSTNIFALPLLRSMRTRSPVLSRPSPPPTAASGEASTIDGEADVLDWRPSDAGQRGNAAFDQRRWRLHVHHLRRPRVADWSDATDEEHRIRIDLQGGIFDTAVIVLGPIEHHGAAVESVWVLRIRQIALPEFVGDHARFMIAESNRFPDSTLKPACCLSGLP